MNANFNYSGSAPQMAPSNDEKLMAALSHASVLVPHLGLIAPLVIWLINRDGRAPFAAYQAKQAFCFHLFVIVVTWLLLLSGFVTFGLGWLLAIVLVGPIHLGAAIYGIIGAIHAFAGRDFRYWLVGDWVQPD